ncbi:MAG: hypothetical protein R2688_02625 [Fimbriimonadaceae bacterium]
MKAPPRDSKRGSRCPARRDLQRGFYGGEDRICKGALVLHALRYLIGDEVFLRSIRRMAYPVKESETWADGQPLRLVTTDDSREHRLPGIGARPALVLRSVCAPGKVSSWSQRRTVFQLNLKWEVPGDLPFPMLVDVVVERKAHRVPMLGAATVTVGDSYVIDPDGWVLRE